jgi:hypothetical protein
MLYEAGQLLLTRSGTWLWLKAWGLRVAQRLGMPRARTVEGRDCCDAGAAVPSASTRCNDHHRAIGERDGVAKSQGEPEASMLALRPRLFPLAVTAAQGCVESNRIYQRERLPAQ